MIRSAKHQLAEAPEPPKPPPSGAHSPRPAAKMAGERERKEFPQCKALLGGQAHAGTGSGSRSRSPAEGPRLGAGYGCRFLRGRVKSVAGMLPGLGYSLRFSASVLKLLAETAESGSRMGADGGGRGLASSGLSCGCCLRPTPGRPRKPVFRCLPSAART